MMLFIGNLHGFEWLVLIPFVLWCIVLIDIIRSNFKDGTTKLIWLIVVIFIPFIGVILYPLFGTNQKLKAPGNDI
jgi:hypothetical protein